MTWAWVAVLGLAPGCDGIELEQLVRQHEPLTHIVEEPRGENCALGGSRVRTGLDADDDGALSDTEVWRTEYRCTTTLPEVKLRTQNVPPGQRCPHGGQVFRAGHDTNANGVLDDDEVTSELYGCTEPEPVVTHLSELPQPPGPCHEEGTLVEAGLDLNRNGALDLAERRARTTVCAAPALVRTRQVVEPVGPTCPTGGIRVEAGTDDDGDTVLEDPEVATSTAVCNALRTYDGDYVVRSAADVVALEGISRIRGSLLISSTPLTALFLPTLTMVEGQLFVSNNDDLKRVELPGLRFVAQQATISFNRNLETLVMGQAGSVAWLESDLHLESNPRLTTLAGLATVLPRRDLLLRDNDGLGQAGAFTELTELSGSLTVEGHASLLTFPVPNLRRLGGSLNIRENTLLRELGGTRPSHVAGNVSIHDNDELRDLSALSQLEYVGGTLEIWDNDHLTSVMGMETLWHVDSIDITHNAELTNIGPFPALTSVTAQVNIKDNPQLSWVGGFGQVVQLHRLSLVQNPLLTDLSGFGPLRTLTSLNLLGNDALTSLGGLSRLETLRDLSVQHNASLVRLDLSALQRVSLTFTIVGNPMLPTCLATELADQVFLASKPPWIADNDSTATCKSPQPSGWNP